MPKPATHPPPPAGADPGKVGVVPGVLAVVVPWVYDPADLLQNVLIREFIQQKVG